MTFAVAKSCTGGLIGATGWLAPFTALIIWGAVYGQVDSTKRSLSDCVCGPKVVVSLGRNIITVCLNRFEAGEDSCTDFVLKIQKPFLADLRFKCAFNHRWHFDSVVSLEPMAQLPAVRANIVVDNEGSLSAMNLIFGPTGDSTKVLLNIRQSSDTHTAPSDTTPASIEYAMEKTAYRCVDHAVYGVVVQRTFTYPPDYMRREPVYNYPELSMFHCGNAVRMPSDHSIAERGFLINYWHILKPPPLKYDDTLQGDSDNRNAKPKAPKKEGFIKIRPLRKKGFAY
jgi:hypothetical protein